eukprot:TRINITY_DN121557_c0_g1_i1.p1 TRINITY_DN121557_c0_g1~~TRINITY_DN121557_c0_g1_i1.p1  ORF type:complete len:353 (-),score=72.01 TRINITY_DN121557_c0_g1_i1:70-1128(-)
MVALTRLTTLTSGQTVAQTASRGVSTAAAAGEDWLATLRSVSFADCAYLFMIAWSLCQFSRLLFVHFPRHVELCEDKLDGPPPTMLSQAQPKAAARRERSTRLSCWQWFRLCQLHLLLLAATGLVGGACTAELLELHGILKLQKPMAFWMAFAVRLLPVAMMVWLVTQVCGFGRFRACRLWLCCTGSLAVVLLLQEAKASSDATPAWLLWLAKKDAWACTGVLLAWTLTFLDLYGLKSEAQRFYQDEMYWERQAIYRGRVVIDLFIAFQLGLTALVGFRALPGSTPSLPASSAALDAAEMLFIGFGINGFATIALNTPPIPFYPVLRWYGLLPPLAVSQSQEAASMQPVRPS